MDHTQLIRHLNENRHVWMIRQHMSRNTDQLSRCASALHRLAEETAAGYEDVRVWGAPSECATLVTKAHTRQRTIILGQFGYDEDTFEREMVSRTTDRWCWVNSHLFS